MKKIIILFSCMLSLRAAEQQGVRELTAAFQDLHVRSRPLAAEQSLCLLAVLQRNQGAIDHVSDQDVLRNIQAFIAQPLERPGHESFVVSCCLPVGLGWACASRLEQSGCSAASNVCCFGPLLYACFKIVAGAIKEQTLLAQAQEEKDRIQGMCAGRRMAQKKDQ